MKSTKQIAHSPSCDTLSQLPPNSEPTDPINPCGGLSLVHCATDMRTKSGKPKFEDLIEEKNGTDQPDRIDWQALDLEL